MAQGDHKGSLTASVNSITNPTVLSGSVVVAVGDLVYGGLAQQTNLTATTTVTDNLGNTYAYITAGTDAGNATLRSFYARVTVAGTLTTINVPATASTNDGSAIASVIEGPFIASPLDANPADTTDGTSPHACPASGTLAFANEVVMAMCAVASNVTMTATAPSVLTQAVARANVSCAVSRRLVNSTSSVTPEFANGATANAVQTTASFKLQNQLFPSHFRGPDPTSISFVTSALGAIGDTTITVPSSAAAGDIIVLADFAANVGATPPTKVIPSDFNEIADSTTGTNRRLVTSYKLAVGSEALTVLTGMNGDTSDNKILMLFRPNNAPASLTLGGVSQEATTGDPTQQTVSSGSGTTPLVVGGIYGANGTITTRTMSPAKDSEVNNSTNDVLWFAYKIYNSSPANVDVDMADFGSNFLQSFYISALGTVTPHTFFTPTVTPGAVALTPSLYTDTDTFHQPTALSTYPITASLFTNTNTFHTPTVAQGGAPQNLAVSLFDDSVGTLSRTNEFSDLATYSPPVEDGEIAGTFNGGGGGPSNFTPQSNSLLVAAFSVLWFSDSDTPSPDDFTLSGGGLTWTPVLESDQNKYPGFRYFAKTYIFTAPVAAASSMQISFAGGVVGGNGDNTHLLVSVVSYTGYDNADPIGATALGDNLGMGANSITLDATPLATSEVFAARQIADEASETSTATPGTGWSEVHDLHSFQAGYGDLETQARTGSTSTTVAWDNLADNASFNAWHSVALAVEIRARSGDLFYAPTVASTYPLTASLFTNTNTFYTHDIPSDAQDLTASLYSDGDTFHSPTVASAYALTADLFSDGDVFHNATVTSTYALTAALFLDDDTFHAHTLAATYALTPDLYADADTFHAATVTPGVVDLTVSLFSDGDTFHSPTVTATYALTASIYTNDNTFYTQTVAATYALTAALFSDGDTFHNATVTATYSLTVDLFSDGDTFFTAAVAATNTLTPDLYVDGDTFHNPTVTAAYSLTAALFTDGDTFHSPTVSPGAVNLTVSLYSDGDIFYSHVLQQDGGDQHLAVDLFSDADTHHGPTVAATYALTAALFADDDVFHSPAVTATASLVPALYVDADVFFSHTVTTTYALLPDHYTDADTFHGPTVQSVNALLATLFADPDAIHLPTIAAGAVDVAPSLFEDPDTFYSVNMSPESLAPYIDHRFISGSGSLTRHGVSGSMSSRIGITGSMRN